jgi:FMN phosphatase YigB (HAD superfamily)
VAMAKGATDRKQLIFHYKTDKLLLDLMLQKAILRPSDTRARELTCEIDESSDPAYKNIINALQVGARNDDVLRHNFLSLEQGRIIVSQIEEMESGAWPLPQPFASPALSRREISFSATVVFDLFGVLLDGLNVLWHVLPTFRDRIGVSKQELPDEVVPSMQGCTGRELMRRISRQIGRTPDEKALVDMVSTYTELVSALPIDELGKLVTPGALEFVDFLVCRRVPVVLMTSTTRDHLLTILRVLDLSSAFYALVSLDDYPDAKPEALKRVLHEIRRRDEHCFFIDDAPELLKAFADLQMDNVTALGFGSTACADRDALEYAGVKTFEDILSLKTFLRGRVDGFYLPAKAGTD